jgi:hypothetical protein
MDNYDAIKQIAHLMESDMWDKLSVRDRHAIEKAQMALKNVYHGYYLHEIDCNSPITYVTRGKIECKKDMIDDSPYITVDGRTVFAVRYGGENLRGRRCEVAIYDNTVDKKVIDEIVEPMLIGNVLLVHDAFNGKRLEEEFKEYDKILREHS